MAVRVDASGENPGHTLTSSSLTALTVMAWVYRVGAGASTQRLITVQDNAATAAASAQLNSSLVLQAYNGTSTASGTTLSDTTWYHIAVTYGATNVTVYLNGVQDAQVAIPSWGAGPPYSYVGGSSSYFNGRFGAYKVFNSEMTADQIRLEMWTVRPRQNAYVWIPAVGEDYLNWARMDYSGNGLNWGSGETGIDIEDNPPVLWGGVKHIIGAAVTAPPAAGPGSIVPTITL